jgi:predicted RND superfamily exporter protein
VSLGIVIIGGLLFALVLTLYVVPALYSYLSSKKKVSELDAQFAEQTPVSPDHLN